jgi:uncharacterized protein (DUF433 family)
MIGPMPACYNPDMRKIIIDPDICNGQPIIEGTRITASTVLEFLSAGDSIEDVLAGYPTLTREDVLACLAYSARLLKHHFEVGAVA